MNRRRATTAVAAALTLASCKREPAPAARGEPPPAVLSQSPGPDRDGGHRVRTLVSGPAQICALYVNGTVACWGEAARRALGLGGSALVPVTIPDVRAAVQISLGECHGCALGRDGRVACWGYRVRASNGDGAAALAMFGAPPCDEAAPVFAAHPTPVRDVPRLRLLAARGEGDWTSGVSEDDRVHAWVPFADEGTKTRMVGMPDDRAPDASGVVELSPGVTTCVRRRDGRATCTQRKRGERAPAEPAERAPAERTERAERPPLLEAPREPVRAIAETHLDDERCFLLTTGAVQCRSARGSVELIGERGAEAIAIAVAVPEICALHADGRVACSEYDAGPTGRATPIARAVVGARAVASSRDQLCALVDDDAICWRPRERELSRLTLP